MRPVQTTLLRAWSRPAAWSCRLQGTVRPAQSDEVSSPRRLWVRELHGYCPIATAIKKRGQRQRFDPLAVATGDFGDGRFAGDLAGTHVDQGIPEGRSAHGEADEAGNASGDLEPFTYFHVVFTTAEDNRANLVAAAPMSGVNHLLQSSACRALRSSDVGLDTGILEVVDRLNHQLGTKLRVECTSITAEPLDLSGQFLPNFVAGYLGMPRRYATYPPEFQVFNVLSTAGASIFGFGLLIPLIYLVWSMRYGKKAEANPWHLPVLEWRTPSPPPTENFVLTPIVTWEAYEFASPEEMEVVGRVRRGPAFGEGSAPLAAIRRVVREFKFG